MKRFSIIMLALMLALALPMTALAAGCTDIRDSVVRIYVEEYWDAYDLNGNYLGSGTDTWYGSGFAIGQPGEPVKYFVTNNHVVEGTNGYGTVTDSNGNTMDAYFESTVQPYIILTDVDHKIAAAVYATSDRADLAVVVLEDPITEREAVVIRPFDDKSDVEGIFACALGFPYVGDWEENATLMDSRPSAVSENHGNVQRVDDHGKTGVGQIIVHSCQTLGGNSGGPLLDEDGYVIGVHFSVWNVQSQGDDGNYARAASSNELIRFLDIEKIDYVTTKDLVNKKIVIIVSAVVAAAVIALVVVLVVKRGGKLVLCGASGSLKGQKFVVAKGAVTNIGRDARRCQIAFSNDADGVSGLHCSIKVVNGRIMVTDENSSYGTWVDGKKLEAGVPVEIKRGQTIYLGSKKQSLILN